MAHVRFEGHKYYVRFSEKWLIIGMKLRLLCRRLLRRVCLLIAPTDFLFYSVITICWFVFSLACYYVRGHISVLTDSSYTFTHALWDIKNSWFSSVILAFVIATYNRGREHQRKIQMQHHLYVDTMATFGTFFSAFVTQQGTLALDFLYSDRCLNDTLTHIQENNVFPLSNSSLIKERLEKITNQLNQLGREIEQRNIIYADNDMSMYFLRDAICMASEMQQAKTITFSAVRDLANRLLKIVDNLRVPWRRDIAIKITILKILNNYQINYIFGDHYYSNLLFGLSSLRKTCNHR